MAWPKKNTRTAVIGGEAYQWQFDERYSLSRWTVIGKKGASGQLLFLDPYWLSTSPGQICQAISFALNSGWEPHRTKQPLKLGAKLLNSTTWTWGFSLLPDNTVPGQMPWTLGAGSTQQP